MTDVTYGPKVIDRPLEQSAASWRELATVVLLVAASDLTIYRGGGYTGCAVMLLIAAAGLFLAPRTLVPHRPGLLISGSLLLLLTARMIWCGDALQVVVGCGLLIFFTVASWGMVPFIPELAAFPSRAMMGGFGGLAAYTNLLTRRNYRLARGTGLNVGLPLLVLFLFSTLFVLANPDLFALLDARLGRLLVSFRSLLARVSPPAGEIAFWVVAAWIAVGMLRPSSLRPLAASHGSDTPPSLGPQQPSPFYPACRNTLLTVIGLFAVYLVFEFETLWFRTFPPGFYYSGYAHQGAAWLTIALALATIVLSLALRGSICADPRYRRLRQLAWIWSLENLLLALAVYHRLMIYIGFNGMSPMRMIGLFGVTSVLVGFLLVIWKIARERSFLWLIQRHLWTVALAICLYAITPVDVLVVRYNVARIVRGDPAPSVQVAYQSINNEGLLLLLPLLDHSNQTIREGVCSLLSDRMESVSAKIRRRNETAGWTAFQVADRRLVRRLAACRPKWDVFLDIRRRNGAWERFADFTYQWY